jgi:hypothetical protein
MFIVKRKQESRSQQRPAYATEQHNMFQNMFIDELE